jgi:hypothetical protein
MLTQRSRLPQRQRRTFGAPGVRRLGRDFNLNLALSGYASRAPQCPLLGVKRTSAGINEMSAFDPKADIGCPATWAWPWIFDPNQVHRLALQTIVARWAGNLQVGRAAHVLNRSPYRRYCLSNSAVTLCVGRYPNDRPERTNQTKQTARKTPNPVHTIRWPP